MYSSIIEYHMIVITISNGHLTGHVHGMDQLRTQHLGLVVILLIRILGIYSTMSPLVVGLSAY